MGQFLFITPDTCMLSSHFFSFFLFLMWTILKVCTEFVTILLLFSILAFWPPRHVGCQPLMIRGSTCTSSTKRQRLNHWTAQKVLFIHSHIHVFNQCKIMQL